MLTLKSIRLVIFISIPFEYWSQLVDILGKPSTPKRPVLKMSIFSKPIGEEGVRYITPAVSNIFYSISFYIPLEVAA